MRQLYTKIILGGLFLINIGILSAQEEVKSHHSSHFFQKHLENTTWIVPPTTLLAYQYLDGTSTAVSDQTVWVIDQYAGGYFFGECYTSINQNVLSQTNLVGSVTPFGDVFITFYPVTGVLVNSEVVNGIGSFRKIDGKYSFVMQMNSAPNGAGGLSHWSYMISVQPGDYFYQNLPGEDMSVPDFISQF